LYYPPSWMYIYN